uniref:Kinesin-like protein n=1 Tax=Coturnix japonica TaxID=93934 RepID=A0A8C2TG13_COTJA
MVKETIRVYARLKPLGRRQQAGIYSVDDETSASSLEITVPRDLADGFINNKRESYKFKFQKVFDQEAKQDVVFESIAKPVAECALAGYNGTIFAYGQTGSGKTFTITGGAERYSDRGIIPRTLSYIFDQLQKDNSKVYTTHVSYLEIYNECGYDLLDPRHEASRLEDLPRVTIMEDPDQNIHLKNLSLQQASNEEEALNLLFLGDTNRMIAETPMNQASTRSHCIFTIHISSKEPGSPTIRHSKLHLVDLAGSERVAKTGVGGHLLTEAKYINLSLHYLEQVIIALAEKNRSHIPYRNSMMTSVLRDSLGGNCMTTMIATLSIDKRNIEESISTCRFAQRVALIKNEAVLNEEIDPKLMIIQLKREIQELKDELALVTGKQRTSQLSQEELLQLDELIQIFLEDSDPESTLDVEADMRKIKYCFTYLKQNHSKISDGKLLSHHICEEKDTSKEDGKEELKKMKELLQQRDNEINILVNMLKNERKKAQDALFQLSAASAGSTSLKQSHSTNLEESQNPSRFFSLKEAKDLSSSVHRLPFISRMKEGKMSLGCQEAFEVFKQDHADSITIKDNEHLLKQRYAEAKCLGEKINEVRNKINHLKGKITQRHIQRAALAVSNPSEVLDALDPVEEKLRSQIEEEKKSYDTMFNRLKGLKVEIEHLQLLMEKAKMKLQKEFEVWWTEEGANLQTQQEKTELVSSPNTTMVYPQFIKSSQHPLASSFSETTRANSNEDPSGRNNSIIFNNPSTKIRTSPSSSTSIPLTGDSQTDADILAFIKARQNILQKKGLGNK